MRSLMFSTMVLGLAGCFLTPMSESKAVRRLCELRETCDEGTGEAAEVCIPELEARLDNAVEGPCNDAVVDRMRCMARLDCASYDAYWTSPVDDYPCRDADLDVDEACSG